MRTLLLFSSILIVLCSFNGANGIFLYGMSSGPLPCTLKNGEIYLGNLPWRTLEENEKEEGEAYQKRLEDCHKKNDFSANCTQPPAFCGGSSLKMYTFPQCIILGQKLYKKEKFVRELTDADKAELNRFNENVEKFKTKEAEFEKKVAAEPPRKIQPPLLLGVLRPGAPVPPQPPKFCFEKEFD
ncbi:unnamed protein product [Anisakis simplex]|uniref:Pepsin-I3 domain-containing protein n=1 Tax=Anisakis simplex TaxID=6269 RepID=A0A0M3K9C1_ANISI|nr:unnamed protein product [Anisakis simplex]